MRICVLLIAGALVATSASADFISIGNAEACLGRGNPVARARENATENAKRTCGAGAIRVSLFSDTTWDTEQICGSNGATRIAAQSSAVFRCNGTAAFDKESSGDELQD